MLEEEEVFDMQAQRVSVTIARRSHHNGLWLAAIALQLVGYWASLANPP
jgi:hypothetical protein